MLPALLNQNFMPGTTDPGLIDDRIKTLIVDLEDLLGVPDNTSIAAAMFSVIAAGLDEIILQDAAANASAAGRLRRNGARLTFHNGTAVKQVAHVGDSDSFAAATAMLFDQDTAPTGWTRDTTVDDRVVKIQGSGARVHGGAWVITGLTADAHEHSMQGHVHGTSSHALTTAELPSHVHGITEDGNHAHLIQAYTTGNEAGGFGLSASGSFVDRVMIQAVGAGQATLNGGSHLHGSQTGAVGSNNAHTHGNTGGPSAGNTSFATTNGITGDGTWRPLHRSVIRATKD